MAKKPKKKLTFGYIVVLLIIAIVFTIIMFSFTFAHNCKNSYDISHYLSEYGYTYEVLSSDSMYICPDCGTNYSKEMTCTLCGGNVTKFDYERQYYASKLFKEEDQPTKNESATIFLIRDNADSFYAILQKKYGDSELYSVFRSGSYVFMIAGEPSEDMNKIISSVR